MEACGTTLRRGHFWRSARPSSFINDPTRIPNHTYAEMDYQGPFEQPHVVSGHDRLGEEARYRRVNDQAIIENPLSESLQIRMAVFRVCGLQQALLTCVSAHFTDEELKRDVANFVVRFSQVPLRLKFDAEKLLRAARVAKDVRLYDDVSRNDTEGSSRDLAVRLTKEEKYALRRERDVPLAERGMWTVVATVSLAAFLQGQYMTSMIGSSTDNIRILAILIQRRSAVG